jgi:hypothetical protein
MLISIAYATMQHRRESGELQNKLVEANGLAKAQAAAIDVLRQQIADIETREVAQMDIARLTAQGCISNRALKEKAVAVTPNLRRDTGEHISLSDSVKVEVRRKPQSSPHW